MCNTRICVCVCVSVMCISMCKCVYACLRNAGIVLQTDARLSMHYVLTTVCLILYRSSLPPPKVSVAGTSSGNSRRNRRNSSGVGDGMLIKGRVRRQAAGTASAARSFAGPFCSLCLNHCHCHHFCCLSFHGVGVARSTPSYRR